MVQFNERICFPHPKSIKFIIKTIYIINPLPRSQFYYRKQCQNILTGYKMKRLFPVSKRPTDFDLIVLGTSLEGLACAKEAASLGASVAVIGSEDQTIIYLQDRVLLEALYDAGKQKTILKEAKAYKWNLCPGLLKHIPFFKFQENKEGIKEHAINRLVEFIDTTNVVYLQECSSFQPGTPIFVASSLLPEDVYTANYFVVAPLGFYEYPDILGAKLGMLPRDLMGLEKMSGSILVIGNSSEALEISSSLFQMGFTTTLMTRDGVTSYFDPQMVSIYLENLQADGLTVHPNTIVKCLKQVEDGKIEVFYVSLSQEWNGSKVFNHVVFAEPPVAKLKPLELRNIKIKCIHGEIWVDHNFQTNVKNVFAIGAAIKCKTFNSGADIQIGKKLARRLFKDKSLRVFNLMDRCGLLRGSSVDYSFIGLSENAAMKVYGADAIEVYHSVFRPTEFAIGGKSFDGCYLKVICWKHQDDKIVGMHISGPSAAAIIQGFAVAMQCGLTYAQLTDMVYIFPTVAKEFVCVHLTKSSGEDLRLESCCS